MKLTFKHLLILLICLIAVAIAQGQTKPPLRLPTTFEQAEMDNILTKLDSVAQVVQRSDMAKTERNSSVDRLVWVQQFMLSKFREQNKARMDSLNKAVKKEGEKK